ncbi:MAG: bifunctional glutamate N-acetyltransferase/amino-acid acetyltransferase ArgJ [Acidimicrobiales bacterium]|jgi:glutamate N-acetyltransferase / amino-acid N-acetyltransferase|nr:bifunctional glutamate N-acetyltransferase/amino-acid acetyltransferase ArgJ [Acidimicrobiales bacterium]
MFLSPLAPSEFPTIPNVQGVQLAVHASGMRYSGRDDLCLVVLSSGSVVGGAFTQSLCPSAPVDWCKKVIKGGSARTLLCNAGNANAFTGKAGQKVVESSAIALAELIDVNPEDVFLASTGVIGEPFPPSDLIEPLPELIGNLQELDQDAWLAAANAIRTTDTFPKGSFAKIDGTGAVIAGIAKGSGMIAPNMATMLAFIFTDISADHSLLQSATEIAVNQSFNCITVDSDTSTSDTVLTFATGKTNVNASDYRDEFQDALNAVMLDLAQQIVRDGEGATKFVEIVVSGAENDTAAKEIGKAIGNSPLVKTAIAAEDANWGRIVMAVGKAGQLADRDRLKIWIGDELVAEGGMQSESYVESKATKHLQAPEIVIKVDVGVGQGSSSIWTCDLTHGYIDINAGYRS